MAATDFWGMLMPPLLGKSLYTLERGHEFRVEEIADHSLLIVTNSGNRRRIRRVELEGAWLTLTRNGTITRKEIREQCSQFNPGYVAAILAQLPGVGCQFNPITLSYREVK